jgi:hypothetical protein
MTLDTIIIAPHGEGGFGVQLAHALDDSACYSPVRVTLETLARVGTGDVPLPDYLKDHGVSLADCVETGVLPDARRYIVAQNAWRFLNDVDADVYVYVTETWIPPSVAAPDAILVRSPYFTAWLRHWWPATYAATRHVYHLPPATAPLPKTDAERVPGLAWIGWAPEDNAKLVGNEFHRRPAPERAEFLPARQLKAEFDDVAGCAKHAIGGDAGVSFDEYAAALPTCEFLVDAVCEPVPSLSRRVLDCAAAGVVPLVGLFGATGTQYLEHELGVTPVFPRPIPAVFDALPAPRDAETAPLLPVFHARDYTVAFPDATRARRTTLQAWAPLVARAHEADARGPLDALREQLKSHFKNWTYAARAAYLRQVFAAVETGLDDDVDPVPSPEYFDARGRPGVEVAP